jgi:hypothetical protein
VQALPGRVIVEKRRPVTDDATDDYVAPKRNAIDHSSDDGSMSPLAVIVFPAKRSE